VALLLAAFGTAGATEAPPRLQHFVFFNRDRERIHEREFLGTPAIAGAQLKYSWRELEPQRGQFALRPLLEDLAFLESHGRRLVVQLQDVTFENRPAVPDWCIDPAFGGGQETQWRSRASDGKKARFDGWVARRWDPRVRVAFAELLDTLGKAIDGRIEALVLPETSLDFGERVPPDFTPRAYLAGVAANLANARRAFPRSLVIQYANFMPGEWLPAEDYGYLRAVYAFAESIGAGVGGPDLLPHRKGQRNHSYPLIAARPAGVRAGLAVQEGNLAERNPLTLRPVTVAELNAFARDSLRLDYLFWGTQEPYYTNDVLPFLRTQPPSGQGR